jgi:phosphosulfolactate phosphohydrolase-like enzyme
VPSGRELVDQGFSVDVSLAEELDADDVVPVLRDGRYIAAE